MSEIRIENGEIVVKKASKRRIVALNPPKERAPLRGKNLRVPKDQLHPAILESRARFGERVAIARRNGTLKPKRSSLSTALAAGLECTVMIDGEDQGITVADYIANQRLIEACMSAEHSGDLPIEATNLILDRLEGKPTSYQAIRAETTTVDVASLLKKLD